jgi:hypothetical protein
MFIFVLVFIFLMLLPVLDARCVFFVLRTKRNILFDSVLNRYGWVFNNGFIASARL